MYLPCYQWGIWLVMCLCRGQYLTICDRHISYEFLQLHQSFQAKVGIPYSQYVQLTVSLILFTQPFDQESWSEQAEKVLLYPIQWWTQFLHIVSISNKGGPNEIWWKLYFYLQIWIANISAFLWVNQSWQIFCSVYFSQIYCRDCGHLSPSHS